MNQKIKVGHSTISGAGLFAIKKIFKNETILVQGGKILTSSKVYDKKTNSADICFLIDEDLLICPINKNGRLGKDGAFLLNHSCNPNCGLRGQILFVAIRDILPREELTYDYAMTDACIRDPENFFKPMSCGCQSELCRKFITYFDWKNPMLQKKYKGYFSGYVEKIIRESSKAKSKKRLV